MSYSLEFKQLFLQSSATIGGKKEYRGPLGHYFDYHYSDSYHKQKSFEDAEVMMARDVIQLAINKAKLDKEKIKVAFGGDLSNQMAISSGAIKNFDFAYGGVFGACSSFILALINAGLVCSNNHNTYALAFTSSSYATSERQFRYPIEYGIQKKDTVTVTVTGAASAVVGKRPTKIKINRATIGNVVDADWDNVNDVGSPMSLAAYTTIRDHLKNNNLDPSYYDLILTGDLSTIGSKILIDCFKTDGIILTNYNDAGNLIYVRGDKDIHAGGSGPACIGLVSMSYIVDKMEKKELKRVLLVGTGALYSPTMAYQHHTIPIVAHAIELEVYEK
ncbi:MAG: stage V sporulation protein AD [Erysipelotrichales bacterium]|nr:stage V sporulation protein AD [Erysipelotrichales bacterium]